MSDVEMLRQASRRSNQACGPARGEEKDKREVENGSGVTSRFPGESIYRILQVRFLIFLPGR
jgi:hypothetical protein